jgi:hypothetical protein
LRVGFPIRKSTDQSSFAAPHGLSQRTTSFIASQRQGIHRIPLLHSFTLIVDVHARLTTFTDDIGRTLKDLLLHEFRSITPRHHGVGENTRSCDPGLPTERTFSSRCHRTWPPRHCRGGKPFFPSGRDRPDPHDWWSQTGSNRRPHACKARALPTELWPRAVTAATLSAIPPGWPDARLAGSATPIRLIWWARKDLNFRPHAYQARALTS